MYGLLRSGFVRKHLDALRRDMYDRLWERVPGIDLSDDSLPAILLQVVALEMMLLWQAMESVFYSRYLGTARGVALDHLGKRLWLPRRPASAAWGSLAVRGEPGTEIPQGTIIRHSDGTKFLTTKARRIGPLGWIDLPISAEEVGPQGNKGPSSTWRPISGVQILSGPYRKISNTFPMELGNIWVQITSSDGYTTFQEFDVSDVHFPLDCDTVRIKVKNPEDKLNYYFISIKVRDRRTFQVLGESQIRRLALKGGEEMVLSFSGQGWDLSDAEKVAFSVHLEENSTGPLLVLANDQAPYGGRFWKKGEQVPHLDLYLEVESQVTGRTIGGAFPESDLSYSRRQLAAVARAAAAIPEAISSNLWAVPGVRYVRVDWNPSLELDHRGLPPKSVRITVAGGKTRDIAKVILERCVAAGIETVGSDTLATPCPSLGQVIPVSFERPMEVPVYVLLKVETDTGMTLTEGAIREIKDAVIRYIGGFLSDGTEVAGRAPAEGVAVSHVLGAVTKFPGIKNAKAWLSRTPFTSYDQVEVCQDLCLRTSSPVEIPVTWPDLIEII